MYKLRLVIHTWGRSLFICKMRELEGVGRQVQIGWFCILKSSLTKITRKSYSNQNKKWGVCVFRNSLGEWSFHSTHNRHSQEVQSPWSRKQYFCSIPELDKLGGHWVGTKESPHLEETCQRHPAQLGWQGFETLRKASRLTALHQSPGVGLPDSLELSNKPTFLKSS